MPLFPLDNVRNAEIDHSIEPQLEDLRTQIADFARSVPEAEFNLSDALFVFDQSRPRLNVLLSLLGAMRGARAVDVGTGHGFLPLLLAQCGLQVTATERDPSLAQFASAHGIQVLPHVLPHSPAAFPPASLDLIVFSEVLEHLKQPAHHVIAEMTSWLRIDGVLLLTTPNVARLAHIEALAAGENFLEPFPEHIPSGEDATNYLEHVREYSMREVLDAVESTGLVVDDARMTGWGEHGYHPLPNPYSNEIIVVKATKKELRTD